MIEFNKEYMLGNTNFWIKVLNRDEFELGVINNGESVGGYRINSSNLVLMINYLKDLDLSVDGLYCMNPCAVIPFYVKRVNEGYYSRDYYNDEWIGEQRIDLETINALSGLLEQVLNEALESTPEVPSPLKFREERLKKNLLDFLEKVGR